MRQDQINQYINNYLKNLRDMKVAEESTQHLRKVLKVVRIKAQETPVIAGDVCRNMYIIVQGGFVCRYIHERTGAAKTINFYLDNLHPIMTCVDSYFLQTPTNCELKAIEDAIVLDIPKHDLDILRKKDAYFAQFYHQMVITAMVEENELKTKLIAYSSKEKYDFIIEELSSVIQRVPSKYIAEFCGISAEWLSKIKKQR